MNKIKETIKYEVSSIESLLDAFKKINTWMNVVALISLVAAIFKVYYITLICLFALIVLKVMLDSKSGEVIAYYRETHDIPNKTKIKRMKDAHTRRIEEKEKRVGQEILRKEQEED